MCVGPEKNLYCDRASSMNNRIAWLILNWQNRDNLTGLKTPSQQLKIKTKVYDF